MRNFRVEELSREDAREIEALFSRVWPFAFEYPEGWRIKRILTCEKIGKEMGNGYHYFGIHVDGKLVGVYKARITESGLFGEHQSVDPEYQGLGLAKAMYQHFIKFAKDHGCPRVYVNILASQAASKRIMGSFGFRKRGCEYEQTKGMLVQMYEKEDELSKHARFSYLNSVLLKINLLCRGVFTSENIDKGRKGGAGPCGGRYVILPNGTCVDLPLQGGFTEKSPFSLVQQDGKWFILRNHEIYVDVQLVPAPAFYEKTTSDGKLMRKVAVLHGKDCLASTVYSNCIHWSSGMQCKFCAIELSQGRPLLIKRPQQLGEVAEEAFKEGAAKHATLTIGTPPKQDKGATLLAAAARGIRERVNLPIHVQLEPPKNGKSLALLRNSGADTVGIHIESFDDHVRSEVCPAKTQAEEYFKAWRESVELFGEGQVSSFIIAGLGESDKSILTGAENLARIGVIPYLLPLRPIEGTMFEHVNPPSLNRMVKLYRKVAETLHSYGLDPAKNKAGCVRCGACSALHEVYLSGI